MSGHHIEKRESRGQKGGRQVGVSDVLLKIFVQLLENKYVGRTQCFGWKVDGFW